LLLAHEIACTPDLKVVVCDLEPRAQIGEFLQDLKTQAGVPGQVFLIGDKEIGIGLPGASSDSSFD